MRKIILWTTACTFSGGLVYFAIKRAYKSYMNQSSNNKTVTHNLFINYGSIIGGIIGFFGYSGLPSKIKFLTNKPE